MASPTIVTQNGQQFVQSGNQLTNVKYAAPDLLKAAGYTGGAATPTVPTATAPVTSTPTLPTLVGGSSYKGATPAQTAAINATIAQINAGLGSLDTSTASPPPTPLATNPSANGTPLPNTNTGAANSSQTTDNMTLASLLQKYQSALLPTQTMTDLQKQAADLEAARRTADTNVEGEGINVGAKTGYEALIDKQSLDKENALQAQYGIAQAQQQATAAGAQAALGLGSQQLSMGQNDVDLLTGDTNAEGQSYSAKQGTANVLALSKAYPDAGILPTDDPNTAAQKASASQSFIAKYGNATSQFNPATGEFEVNYTSKLGTTTPGSAYTGNPNGNGTTGGTTLGTSGGTTLAQGSTGSAVSALQSFLVSKGYMTPAQVATGPGVFGPQTAAAVAAFQQASGVDTSGGGVGVFGPKTQAAAAGQGMSLAGTLTGGGTNLGSGSAAASAPTPTTGTSLGTSGGKPLTSLSSPAFYLATTGEYPSGYKYSTQQNQLMDEVRKAIPNFNPTVAKANAKAISDQTGQLANITSALNSADNTFSLLLNSAKAAGINSSTIGSVNAVKRAAQQGLLSDADVAKFNSSIETVKTEYAQVLGRGGEVTDAVRKMASDVVDKNLQVGSLSALQSRLVQEGQIAIKARQDEIASLASGGTSSSGSSSSSGGGSVYNGITLPN